MASNAASSFSGSNTAPELHSPDDTDRTVEAAESEPHWHEKDRWIFIRAFTPAWFTVSMGTGIASVLLHNLPYNGAWLYWLSVIVFVLNIALFILFMGITIMRYFLYPGLWTVMMHHPTQPLFLGAFPIALATIVEMIALVCVPAWGPWAATLAWALWWVDAAISIVACYCIPFFIMYKHDSKLPMVTGLWLLPIAPAIVSSGVGGVVADTLENETHALWTVMVCYVLWGTALPLSFSILVIYLHRLTMHSIPPREAILSTFIPIATLGQSGFTIMQLGKVAAKVFPRTGMLPGSVTPSGDILYVLGWIAGVILWAYSLAWLFFSLASLSRGKFPFNLGWWSFTFPLGVWTSSAILCGQEMASRFFTVLGTVLAVIVILLWLMVSVLSIRGIVNRSIFVAPDFEIWKAKHRAAMAPAAKEVA